MPEDPSPSERLDSWKEIAAYLRRDVTTVQRWEKREGMPVHRHQHDRIGSVFAYRAELDAWSRARSLGVGTPESAPVAPRAAADSQVDAAAGSAPFQAEAAAPGLAPSLERGPYPATRRPLRWMAAGVGALLVGSILWAVADKARAPEEALGEAHFQQLTDFEGIEQAAAISRDGRFVAFQSDRDGRMDVWLTQVGTGRFSNLTPGRALDLVNPSVRTLGFSPDGSLVTFWARGPPGSGTPEIGIWAVPLLGGLPQSYLEGVAEFDWSPDGRQLAFHTPGPGDPMSVRAATPGSEARALFTAPSGLHSHYPTWSPDQAFLVFVHGVLPDRMDLWRIGANGGTPERMTHHDAQVSHPVFLDQRTLLYLVTDPDGSGPWIESLDLATKVVHRFGSGLDRYTSLSASADGRRVVATRANPKTTLWRVPLAGARGDMAAASRIPLDTASGTSPRFGPGYLLYVSPHGTGASLWKRASGSATELWSSPEALIVGAPAVDRDGRRIAFTVRERGRTALRMMNADGTGLRSIGGTLEVEGTPAWAPDGRTLTVAARVDGVPRVFSIPLDDGSPSPLVREHSIDPAWSPQGDLLAYSGPDVGTTFPVRAVHVDGGDAPLAALTLSRGARHVAFATDGRALLVLKGDLGHKALVRVDAATGVAQQLLVLPEDFDLRDFDVSPDGRELVLEQRNAHSDLVLIELRPR